MPGNINTALFNSAIGGLPGRTLGAWFSDVKNVIDFGADATGTNDSTAAIQAAYDYTTAPYSSKQRGIIFFPPGVYKVTQSIICNDSGGQEMSVCFAGCGKASTISGTFNDFLIKRDGLPTNDIGNSIRVFDKLWFQNGHATGGCVKWNASIGTSFTDCVFDGARGLDASFCQGTRIQSCAFSPNGQAGSTYAIALGDNGIITNHDITGFNTGIMLTGNIGCNILGGRMEVNQTAIAIGLDTSGGTTAPTGFIIEGGSFESNGIAIDFVGTGSGFKIGGLTISGSSISGGHPQYGIRVQGDHAQFGEFSGISVSFSQCDVAAISVADTTNRNCLVFSGVTAINAGSGVAWVTPATAHTATFINCNINPTYLFSGLPSGANLRTSDTYYITDGNQAMIGENVTAGGGSNRSWVSFNGTNWIRGT